MEIEEVKRRILEASVKIKEIVASLEDDCGVRVDRIDYDRHERESQAGAVHTARAVSLDTRISW